ncbi:MAG TPA: tetratricopeptide repeat protein, partial [Pyrinomonadaceae bacterium]|nr:tetratricopeptide repeat protein [Pyrinomonadaceae bacterium]
QRQFDEAERWYRQSLAIEERIGDKHGQAASLYQLGMNAEGQGSILEAIAFYTRAEELVTNLNDPYHLEMVQSALKRVRGE